MGDRGFFPVPPSLIRTTWNRSAAREGLRVENRSADETKVLLYDEIGFFGVTAGDFVRELAGIRTGTIDLHINSPGGDVFGALNIANALRDQQVSKQRTVVTICDGLAASAASIILMAGSTVRIADNALVMIHNPWTIAIGDVSDMEKVVTELKTVRNTIIATYKWHSSLDDEALGTLMDAETWMDASEALANGFATEQVEGLKATASLNPKAMAQLKIPDKFRARAEALVAKPAPAPVAASPVEVVRLCRESGVQDLAEDLLTAGATTDQVTARIATEQTARAAAATRATEITGLCAKAKLPELAAGYIKGAMAIDDVRTHLTTVTAKLDHVEIDGGLDPDRGAQGQGSWKKAFARVTHRGRAH